jgi:hypothetical protein
MMVAEPKATATGSSVKRDAPKNKVAREPSKYDLYMTANLMTWKGANPVLDLPRHGTSANCLWISLPGWWADGRICTGDASPGMRCRGL